MKRIPFFALLLLVIPLHACGELPIPGAALSPIEWTAAWQTLTATAWTPTISPTPVPKESKIVDWLNAELLEADALEQTIDARYQVVDVSFLRTSDGVAILMRVDVRCECATFAGCCNQERMFIKVMTAMQKRHDKILEQVPNSISEMRVVCYDHTTYFGAMAASWSDTKSYLHEEINGRQYGARVYRSFMP